MWHLIGNYRYPVPKYIWGKIVQILLDSKCMNPVIYFDELDKISDTPKGEEIAGILTHLTDTSQNSQFHDKYFAEIDFDLSKCLFIFSYNDESKVNPILRDRMYRIQTKGYEMKEKLIIARKHLLPKIREQVNFKEDEVIIQIDKMTQKPILHLLKEMGLKEVKIEKSLTVDHYDLKEKKDNEEKLKIDKWPTTFEELINLYEDSKIKSHLILFCYPYLFWLTFFLRV